MVFGPGNGNGVGGRRRRIQRIQLLALLPVTLAAVINCGYQYYRGMALLPGFDGSDVRSRLATLLSVNPQSPGLYDYLAAGVSHLLPMLLLALMVGGFWERIIAERRQRPMESGFVLVALLFVLLLPGAAAFSHIIFGMSCAIILGKGIFGGEGKSFVNPALLGMAMVQVSYPASSAIHPLWNGVVGYTGSDAIALYHRAGEAGLAQAGIDTWSAFIGAIPGTLGTTSLLAIVLGAGLLLVTRVISWRLLAAQFIGLLLFAGLVVAFAETSAGPPAMPLHWHLLLGSFAFGAVFIACDPVASASTNPGRWIQGFLIAGLVVLIRVANSTHPDAVIPVLLLVSLLAPLIDHAVIAWNIHQRARRHV
jgi:Na+-transporting NADH:ubiquinone oxidoreductase subunit B